ncbi:hypothetical protein V1290_000357 [Bradyrhizobium sp. AZCC 1578]
MVRRKTKANLDGALIAAGCFMAAIIIRPYAVEAFKRAFSRLMRGDG